MTSHEQFNVKNTHLQQHDCYTQL